MEKPPRPPTERRTARGQSGLKLEKARIKLLRAGRKPMGPLRTDRKIASIAMRYALDAAGLDPKKPEDKEVRGTIHLLAQRGIILSDSIKSTKAGTELEAKKKRLRWVTSRIVEMVERSKGEAARKKFVQAYNEHRETLSGLRG